MRLLLDTHVVLWQLAGARALGARARETIAAATELAFSVVSPDHGLAVARLPPHHRDPFDRLLVVQAQQEGFTLVIADTRIHAYDVAVLDPLS